MTLQLEEEETRVASDLEKMRKSNNSNGNPLTSRTGLNRPSAPSLNNARLPGQFQPNHASTPMVEGNEKKKEKNIIYISLFSRLIEANLMVKDLFRRQVRRLYHRGLPIPSQDRLTLVLHFLLLLLHWISFSNRILPPYLDLGLTKIKLTKSSKDWTKIHSSEISDPRWEKP